MDNIQGNARPKRLKDTHKKTKKKQKNRKQGNNSPVPEKAVTQE